MSKTQIPVVDAEPDRLAELAPLLERTGYRLVTASDGQPFLTLWKQKARELKLQTYALYFAARDPRVPWLAKGLTLLVVAYAFSPIDLIPDFIPVLGYLDDLILIPLGVAMVIKLIPADVMADCRSKAEAHLASEKPVFRWAGALIVGLWIVAIGLLACVLYRRFASR